MWRFDSRSYLVGAKGTFVKVKDSWAEKKYVLFYSYYKEIVFCDWAGRL